MIRSSLFLAVLAACLATPAAADDSFRSPLAANSQAAGKIAAARAERAEKAGLAAAAVTVEEVGDADSFGKPVKWLGLMSGSVELDIACTPAAGEPANPNCVTLNPAPAATVFNLVDVASITLPGKSSETMLCHWQTPIISYSAMNTYPGPQTFSLRATPRYRIQSEVLENPALIDATTGLPFGGSIELSLTSVSKANTLEPGQFQSETLTGTRMCIGGLVSRASLINQYGLTAAQAKQFFRKPITITMSIGGQVRLVEGAIINFGTRFVGD